MYDFKVLFIESRLNPSDWVSRLEGEKDVKATFPRFLEGRIFNGDGELIPIEKVFFCKESRGSESILYQASTTSIGYGTPIER